MPKKNKVNPNQIEMLYGTLNGKEIVYNSATQFLVESGKDPKGGYKTTHVIMGSLEQAFYLYERMNINYGFKKRLTMDGKVLIKKRCPNFRNI